MLFHNCWCYYKIQLSPTHMSWRKKIEFSLARHRLPKNCLERNSGAIFQRTYFTPFCLPLTDREILISSGLHKQFDHFVCCRSLSLILLTAFRVESASLSITTLAQPRRHLKSAHLSKKQIIRHIFRHGIRVESSSPGEARGRGKGTEEDSRHKGCLEECLSDSINSGVRGLVS